MFSEKLIIFVLFCMDATCFFGKIRYLCRRKAALGNLKTSFHCARLRYLCRRKAALGNLKASFHCTRLHFLYRRKAALGNLKAAFIVLVCITNILNYIIMLGTELPHVVQARAEGPETPSPG